jgi:hypothetical protein
MQKALCKSAERGDPLTPDPRPDEPGGPGTTLAMRGNERGNRAADDTTIRRSTRMNMNTVYFYLAALYASSVIALYIKQCRVIVTKMTGNANFANPPVPLAQLTTALNTLETLEEATLKGPKGSATTRDAQLRVVRGLMRQTKGFVQSVADSDVANAQAIIESSGYSVGKKVVRTKQALTAKYGSLPTTLLLVAKALKVRTT